MRGFTLLELMTTLAIFGLVATLSIASLGPLKDRYSHQLAVEIVTGAIARAQLMARESGRCHAIQVYGRDNSLKAPNFPGERVNIMRRPTANCGDGGATAPALELVETMLLPDGNTFQIAFSVQTPPIGSEVEVRPNGRQRKELRTTLLVNGRRNQQTAVVIAAPGNLCVFPVSDGTAVGNCP